MYFISIYHTFCASSEVIFQVLFISEQPKKNKIAFASLLSQIKLLFGWLVIQLVWYILNRLFTSVSVKVVDIYFSNSLIIHHVKTKKITTVKEVWIPGLN